MAIRRLDRVRGWKAIAEVLGVDERTARRIPDLPVYSITDAGVRPRVVADVIDLSRWLSARKQRGIKRSGR